MQTIYLDISNKGVVPTIYAKQGDVGRKFEVVFTDSGFPYVFLEGLALSVWYSGASGEGNYTDIGDKSAFSVNGNKVTVEMIAQMLLNDGDGIMSLVLNSADGKQIGSWNIPYICESVPGFESEEAKEYYTAFSEAVSKLHQGVGQSTEQGGEIFNFYTDPVYTGDNPPKEYPGNTAAKGSHAQNFGTHADGEYSSASGWNSTASGGIANATGRETLASGYAATTEGHLTTASGRCAHAGGKESKATAENAFAFGEGATSSGKNAFACGKNAKASNTQAFAIGNATEAYGSSSFAGGSGTKATASQAIATGNGSEATGVNSFAHGIRAKSTGNTSFAIGEDTEAGGYYAIASGYKTKALGTCTMAGGRDTEVKAEAYAATAIGRGTIANSRYQFVRGQYNKPDEPDPNKSYIGQYAEIVGNGTASAPENIYTLDWDGNGWFGGDVYVGEFYGRHKKLATEDKIPTTAAAVGAVPTTRTVNGRALSSNISLTASDVGAAPAGIVYDSVRIASGTDADLMTRIESVFSQMPNNTVRFISVSFGASHPNLGGSAYLFTIYRTTEEYGCIEARSYASSQGRLVRNLSAGHWDEWEHENPPMMPNVEYRTTERSGGLPVYTKTFGVQPNVMTPFGIGEYDHGITGFKYLCRVEARTENYVLPLITNERTVCIAGVTATKVKIAATKQDFTDYTSITLWYTKN